MSRSAEQIALDEKIARIRKQNEEIIRRRQIIDEEIKNAERQNAIVNVKKTYSDEDDKPSLYADSFSTRQPKTTVTYPKVKVTQVIRNDRERSKHEDVAWRREREQIDNERIRRQKAASGWKREWDANKTLENDKDSVIQSNQRRPAFRSQRGRSNEYTENDRTITSSFSQGNRPPADDDMWQVNRDTSYRSQPRKSRNDESQLTSIYKSHERKLISPNNSVSNRVTVKPDTRNDLESTRSWCGKEERGNSPTDARTTTIVAENKSTTCWPSSGPLHQKKATGVQKKDPSNIVISNVTKCSETKTSPWKSEFSGAEENLTLTLSERLKNIVIHVKNDDVKETERIVELIDKPPTYEGHSSSTGFKPSTYEEHSCPTSFTSQPPTTSLRAGILKKSPEVTRSNAFQAKKSVIIQENVEVNEKKKSEVITELADGNSDSEWEDVSDGEEWADVSD